MKLYYETKSDELLHYGVPGMKWGVRRAKAPTSGSNTRFGSAKAKYKAAKKAYNEAYNRAEGYSGRHPISQFIGKKQKAESDKRWYDAHTKARELDAAKKEYKAAKADRKAKLKAAKAEYKNIRKTLEKEYGNLEDQMTYGKKADHKKNAQLQKKMDAIEKKLNSMKKKK